MQQINSRQIIQKAFQSRTVIPGFNIPYLPMMKPVVDALRDTGSFGFIMVARLEWMKFKSVSLEAVIEEYEKCKDITHTRLHLDHIPVIDEDEVAVDYLAVIKRALDAGYDSVMVDGSRLPLMENIAHTRAVVDLAHARGVAVEAELGAVMGHEAGPLPPYEELFTSGRGFTDPDEAAEFVRQTGVDWLSVAVGNIHGAISAAKKDTAKFPARLDLDRVENIRDRVEIPLVLHGGTGIPAEQVAQAIKKGIAKINIATAIRQPYEKALAVSTAAAQKDG